MLEGLALERGLTDLPNFMAGPVEYVQLNAIDGIDAGDIHRLPFLNDTGFRDEQEYRLLGFAPDRSGSLSVALTPGLIRHVMVEPSKRSAVVDSLRIAPSPLPSCRDLRVGQSSRTLNETWLEALGRIAEHHGMVCEEWRSNDPGNLPDDYAPGCPPREPVVGLHFTSESSQA